EEVQRRVGDVADQEQLEEKPREKGRTLSKKKSSLPFWKRKSLSEMTPTEWESLCDGCGRCCLNKFEDDDGRVFFTDVSCKLLNTKTCACTDYPNRKKKVPDCIRLTPKIMPKMNCLPKTCAYRLLYEGKELPWWHHLRSGSRKTDRKSVV